jgi:catechol 2,3-dioxygenase-like lactoylglutathione lyase family enzyme
METGTETAAATPTEAAPGDTANTDAKVRAEPPPYLPSAPYLSDGPEEVTQGLRSVHNVSVTLIVASLRRSLTFYRDLLGLTEIDTGVGSAVLASGNARILLREVTDARPVDRRVVHLNLEVDDVHEAYERLRREGVEFNHPPRVVNQGEQLEQWAATLRDPDGHAIALTRWEIRP